MSREQELRVLIPNAAKEVLDWAESVKRVNVDNQEYLDFSYIYILKDEINTLESLKRELKAIIEKPKP